MADICTDNRFELIEKYKKELIESTNIESSQDEMRVLDNLLFRFWQMGWLDKLEQPERKTGKWIHDGYDFPHGNDWIHCSECGKRGINVPADLTNFCPNCGARMEI